MDRFKNICVNSFIIIAFLCFLISFLLLGIGEKSYFSHAIGDMLDNIYDRFTLIEIIAIFVNMFFAIVGIAVLAIGIYSWISSRDRN